MAFTDIIRRSDVTPYYYVLVQSIAEAWVPIGETRSFTGHTLKAVLAERQVAIPSSTLEPFQGIGSSGSIALRLADRGGYLANLISAGTETWLTDDIDPSDLSIEVASTAAFASAGTVHVHREGISYTAKDATHFLNCTRNVNDLAGAYVPPHRIPTSGGSQPEGASATVRVGTTPKFLLGRWISVNIICLDPEGQPILDEDGSFHWEIWRGIISSFPPSPDEVQYRLLAEGLERVITETPPVGGIEAELVPKAYAPSPAQGKPWKGFDVPMWISTRRRFLSLRFVSDAAGFPGYPDASGNQVKIVTTDLLAAGPESKWMTKGQISEQLRIQLEASLGGTWTLWCDWEQQTDQDSDKTVFVIRTYATGLAYGNGNLVTSIITAGNEAWEQLGFVGEQSANSLILAGGVGNPPTFYSTELPAALYVAPDDDEIPFVAPLAVEFEPGYVKIGDEIVSYETIETIGTLDGEPAKRLTGCVRGFANTIAQTIMLRIGDADLSALPKIESVFVAGGGAGTTPGSDEPDPNVFVSLWKILTGTRGDGLNGSYADWPGLGIPNVHLDTLMLTKLKGAISQTGAIFGEISNLRSWISDALALEGYAIVGKMLSDGTYRLSPVRIGAAGKVESPIVCGIDASEEVRIGGGLEEIINHVAIEAPRGKADYYDWDSWAQFGVLQERGYRIPLADANALVFTSLTVQRIFLLSKTYFLGELSIDTSGRFVAPGDVVTLTFPNPVLTGAWRVLSASTPLRGRGTIRLSAMRVPAWNNLLYAPTATIQSILGNVVTLGANEGALFRVGANVGIYDPSEYSDGVLVSIVGIDGDDVELSSVVGVSALDLVEFVSEPTANGEDRYLWLIDDTYFWGD